MGASNYLEVALLNEVLRGVEYASPPTVYVALYLSNPNETDVGVEISGGAYARRAAVFSAPSQDASTPTKAVTSNASVIEFPQATTNWGTVTHFGIRDAGVGGNLLFYGELTTAKAIETGDRLRFNAGELVISLG